MSVTMKELRAACPGADSDFLLRQLEAGGSVTDARRDWIAEQNKRLAKAQAHARVGRNASAAVLEPEELDIDGAIERFDSSVCDVMTAQHLDRHRAIAIVAMRNPALHKAFLVATNPGARASALSKKSSICGIRDRLIVKFLKG